MNAKRSSGKSIVQNFGSFTNPEPQSDPAGMSEGNEPAATAPRVGAGVIGATARSLADMRAERERLTALVESGGWIELDPGIIDPSPFPDRLPDDNPTDFAELKRLVASEGQKVPIQVRAHPNVPGRYQIVFGHRRCRAALDLGIKVKAIVVSYSDAELVVAQGIENSARQDLTWIERALFVRTMDSTGIKARDVRAALSIDDPELARLRQVVAAVPVDIIQAIGRAPKVGRPRWIALAGAFSGPGDAATRVRETLSADKVRTMGSDDRFTLAFASLSSTAARSETEFELKAPSGIKLGKAVIRPNLVRLSLKGKKGENFAAFLEQELPALIERFFDREGEG